jgi:hypothetical protein
MKSEPIASDGHLRTVAWPDPSPAMLERPEFEIIWQVIKRWDINVPEAYSGYCGVTGNHVRAILDALDAASYGRELPERHSR